MHFIPSRSSLSSHPFVFCLWNALIGVSVCREAVARFSDFFSLLVAHATIKKRRSTHRQRASLKNESVYYSSGWADERVYPTVEVQLSHVKILECVFALYVCVSGKEFWYKICNRLPLYDRQVNIFSYDSQTKRRNSFNKKCDGLYDMLLLRISVE